MKTASLFAVMLGCVGCVSSVTSTRAVTEIPTQELCSLRLVDNNFDRVITELERRNEFSDDDLLQIRRRAVVPGMSDAAVRCSYGTPRQVVSNSPGEDFDTVYVYGLEMRNAVRRLGEIRVYLAGGQVVRSDSFAEFVN